MCYHYGLSKSLTTVQERFGAQGGEGLIPFVRAGAFDGDVLRPILTAQNPAVIQGFYWGLVPSWSKTVALTFSTHNAMAETAAEKPAFRKAFVSQRCLIPADGFYEWQQRGAEKAPYWIQLKGADLFAFAGLYDGWKDPVSGVERFTFTLLTTIANPLMAHIHNVKQRMPVILPPGEEHRWLQGDDSLLTPYPEAEMEAWPIARDVLKRGQDPGIRNPVEEFPRDLFG
jgi:putative SOS response-associated peptidase YedK